MSLTAKELELIKAYKEYINFLGEEYDEVFNIANIHGYNCEEYKINLGQQMRNAIKKLEEECGIERLISVDK